MVILLLSFFSVYLLLTSVLSHLHFYFYWKIPNLMHHSSNVITSWLVLHLDCGLHWPFNIHPWYRDNLPQLNVNCPFHSSPQDGRGEEWMDSYWLHTVSATGVECGWVQPQLNTKRSEGHFPLFENCILKINHKMYIMAFTSCLPDKDLVGKSINSKLKHCISWYFGNLKISVCGHFPLNKIMLVLSSGNWTKEKWHSNSF